MADVSSTLQQWSITESSNNPSGSTVIGSGLDDNLRQIQAVTRAGLAYYNSTPIASASTVDLNAATGNYLDISGTTTITAFGTASAGIWKVLRFTGALTLTHNGTSLILPGSASITTANGDTCEMYSLGSGNWKCAWYQKVDGTVVLPTFNSNTFRIADNSDSTKKIKFDASGITTGTTRTYTVPDRDDTIVTLGGTQTLTSKTLTSPSISSPTVTGTPVMGASVLTSSNASASGTAVNFTSIPSWVKRITIMFSGVSTSGTDALLVQIGSGSVTTTGYSGAGSRISGSAVSTSSSSSGLLFNGVLATDSIAGHATITALGGGNAYIMSGTAGDQANTLTFTAGSVINLGGTLDRVRITTIGGTDTFDSGSFGIIYE